MKARTLAYATLIAGSLFGGSARADDGARTTLAESLFQQGKSFFVAGKIAEACAAFAESQRVEPKLGTLFHLATCHEHQGRTATAWAEFQAALAAAHREGQTEREAYAREHVARLEPRLTRVRIAKPAEAGASVTLDGVPIGAAALDAPLPLDPGKHTVRVTAPGKSAWEHDVTAPAGPSTAAVDVPRLEDAPADASPRPVASPAAASRESAMRKASGGASPLVIASFATGAAGVALGTLFGLMTISEKNAAQPECSGSLCTQRGLDRFADAHRFATASDVAFVVGALGAVAGVALLFVPAARGRTVSLAPSVDGRGVGVAALGAF